MGWSWDDKGSSPYLTIEKWQENGIDLGFTSRIGGVSQVPFNTNNLGLHVGDESTAVVENRRLWCDQRQISWKKVAVGEQVHGTNVLWVNPEDGGRGVLDLQTAIPRVDGLVTLSHVGLMAFFADCVPLFFYHPILGLVGIAHAGWKGTALKIGQKVLETIEEAGGRIEDVLVAIGPSIGPCCYVVDNRVADLFSSNFRETPFLSLQEDGHYLLDLWEANRQLLMEKGVRSDNIDVASICTADNPQIYFSHRRDGDKTGRMAGWIRRKGQ